MPTFELHLDLSDLGASIESGLILWVIGLGALVAVIGGCRASSVWVRTGLITVAFGVGMVFAAPDQLARFCAVTAGSAALLFLAAQHGAARIRWLLLPARWLLVPALVWVIARAPGFGAGLAMLAFVLWCGTAPARTSG